MYASHLQDKLSVTNHHPFPSFGKDFSMVLKTHEEMNAFVPISKRQHDSFKLKCGLVVMDMMLEQLYLKGKGRRHTNKKMKEYVDNRTVCKHRFFKILLKRNPSMWL
jgi:hypothetical protein